MIAEHHQRRLERLERLARRMDRAFRIPGTGIRVGWDGIIGLVPGVGDTLTLLPAAWILAEAHRMGAPTGLKLRMGLNTGLDWALGLVPLAGDILDIGIKSNSRNVALLRAHFEREMQRAAPDGLPSTGRQAPTEIASDQPTSSRPEKK